MAALRALQSNGKIQALGCDALRSIAGGGAACAQAVVDAGGVPAIVAALRVHLRNGGVQTMGCSALHSIASNAGVQAVMVAGGVALATGASKAHPKDALVQTRANNLLNLLEQAHSVADAAMEALLAEEGAAKEASSRKRQGKSKKASLKLDHQPATSALLPLASGGRAILPVEPTAEARGAADEALRRTMAGGDADALARALEAFRSMASEQVLNEARADRDRLAKKRKKESQRLRKVHAGAMSALPQLQALDEVRDVGALREGLASATAHEGVLPALDEELEAARVRLDQLVAGDGATMKAVGPGQAWELTLENLDGVWRQLSFAPPQLNLAPFHCPSLQLHCPSLPIRSCNRRLCRS